MAGARGRGSPLLRELACRGCGRSLTAAERATVAADMLRAGLASDEVVGWCCPACSLSKLQVPQYRLIPHPLEFPLVT